MGFCNECAAGAVTALDGSTNSSDCVNVGINFQLAIAFLVRLVNILITLLY